MKAAPTRLLLVLSLALLAGCSTSSNSGSVQFAVSVRQELAASISRVSVTSSAADIPSVTVDLAPTHGVWGGIIGNIPAGSNRAFLAQAFDSSGTKLFEGSASGITITANQATLVAITLQEVNPPPPFQNEAPLIDSLVASTTTVAPGGSITLQATTHDPNTGDTLSYAWSSTGGSFSSASAASTSWTAPLTVGIQTLTLTVTDSGGLSSSISLAINVAQSGGDGDALLSISFNSSPRVASLTASPTQLAVGQATAVSASASDPDGDSLSYTWSATCAGSWANASSSSAQFTPSALPADVCNNCRLSVTVSDGRGGQTTGTVALCVSNTPPMNHFPPVIIRSYRSSDTASAGQMLTYEVVASDPEGSALTFSWAASAGTLGTAANGPSNSRITWTAPSCASASPTITATITNAFNLTATRSFAVAGLAACASASWAPTGSVATPRWYHTATLLPDGKVLITGGRNNFGTLPMSELYDPASGTWSPTGSMAEARELHTATLLPNGKVLVTGGHSNGHDVATAELYDPSLGTWSATGSMAEARELHTATLLPNGTVLVTGGRDISFPFPSFATAELYDPASGTWSTASSMATPRHWHSATLLPGGKVLVTGGFDRASGSDLATAEVYDPALNTWSATGSMAAPRSDHEATLLPNGKVLVTGGWIAGGSSTAVESYDPVSGTWSSAGSMATSRIWGTTTLLANGTVLISGGFSFSNHELMTAEVYNPVASTWSTTASMASRRNFHTATLLANGKVLVVSGSGWEGDDRATLSTAELYTP